jgi:hypothetical protein
MGSHRQHTTPDSKQPHPHDTRPPHDEMADPEVHDGMAEQPGSPEPGDDPRQGHRSQKNSI